MNTLLCVLFFCSVCSSILAEVHENPSWDELSKLVRHSSLTVSRGLSQYVQQGLRLSNVSDICERSVSHFYTALSKGKLWSVQMADAGGKIPGGVFNGNLMDFGSFEQCLRIRVRNASRGEEAFRGRYCMVGYQSLLISQFYAKDISRQSYLNKYGQPPEWAMDYLQRVGPDARHLQLWLGTCVPSACTEDEVGKMLSDVMKPLGIIPSVAGCDMDESKEWPKSAVVAIFVLGFLVSMCIIGTILDILADTFKSLRLDHYSVVYILKSFSIRLNTLKLCVTREGSDSFRCFDGLKFFMITWVIFGHNYALTDLFTYHRFGSSFQRLTVFGPTIKSAIIESTSLNVSTFFFMSGFFLLYTEFPKLERNGGKLSIFWFTFRRIVRYNISISFGITLLMALQVMGSGPLWKPTIDFYIGKCHRNWWSNFLYINNYWKTRDMCLGPSWYFSTLLQLQLIGVAVLLLLYRSPFAGLLLGIFLAVASCIHDVFLLIWKGNFTLSIGKMKDLETGWNYINDIYYRTPHHVTAFLIGMVIAYIVIKHNDRKPSQVFLVVGWALSCSLLYFALCGVYGPDTIIYKTFYTSCFRTAWAIGIGWLTYACVTGYGGIINHLLTWRPLTTLGFLSNMTSFLHWVFMVFLKATQRERQFYGNSDLSLGAISLVVFGHFIGYIGYLTVEAPLTTLTGIFFRKYTATKNKSD